jgi:hypothetical protein
MDGYGFLTQRKANGIQWILGMTKKRRKGCCRGGTKRMDFFWL